MLSKLVCLTGHVPGNWADLRVQRLLGGRKREREREAERERLEFICP